jgi:hypothetical protein
MERVPHHAPAHLRLKPTANLEERDSQNDWYLFLTKPWTMERFGADLGLDEATTMCQDQFCYKDIISCVKEPQPHSFYNHTIRYSEHQPYYEMKKMMVVDNRTAISWNSGPTRFGTFYP